MLVAGFIRDRLGYARARLSVFIQLWTWSSSQTTNFWRHLAWGYWFVGQGRTPLVTLVCKEECSNGGEPEPVRWTRRMHPLAQRNESLFGPQNQPKLITSLIESREFCEFKVRRRAPGEVPSSIRLDHGEYEHRTVPGLQGPRVDLTYCSVTQHTASCPLAGVVGCVLPTCVQGSAEPGFPWVGGGENYIDLCFGTGPPFVNPCVVPSG